LAIVKEPPAAATVTVAVDVVEPEAFVAVSVNRVVAVGLTPVEPVADVDVKVPGVMAILVAPDVAQLNVLLAPEVMADGSAAKEAIVGAEVFPAEEVPGDEVEEPQSASPKQASRMRTRG